MTYIKTVKRGNLTYYQLWDKGKFVKHIGNAAKLQVFQRDQAIGQEAAKILAEKPYLNPKGNLAVIAAAKKEQVGKIVLPDKQYRTIVVDPPWMMEKILRDERTNQKDFDYPTMELDEIKMLPIERMAVADGCHIYLWTTQKYLPDAFDILRAWGVEYQCLMVWHKNVGFTPFSWMYNGEFCLFGHIGSLPLVKMGMALVFSAKVREHSRKPDEFYDLVRQASPEPRLDMFAREQREGFETWGNEENKYGI